MSTRLPGGLLVLTREECKVLAYLGAAGFGELHRAGMAPAAFRRPLDEVTATARGEGSAADSAGVPIFGLGPAAREPESGGSKITVAVAAARLGVTTRRVRALVAELRLDGEQLGGAGSVWLISEQSVADYEASRGDRRAS